MQAPEDLSQKSLARFEALIRKFHDLLDSAQVSTVAWQVQGEWRSLSTLIRIGGPRGQNSSIEVKGKLFASSQSPTPGEAARLLRKVAEEGELTIDGRRVVVSVPGFFYLDPRARPFFYSTPYETGLNTPLVLRKSGGQTDEVVGRDNPRVWEEIDNDLREYDPPFEDLADLTDSTLGYPLGPGYNVSFHGLLLLPFKVLGVEGASSGNLHVNVAAHPRTPPEDINFGVVIRPEAGSPQRLSVPLSGLSFAREPHRPEVVTVTLPLSATGRTTIHLRVREELLSTLVSYGGASSPALQCHRVLDADGRQLERALTEFGGEKFEAAVCMLLHLAGFKVEWTGLLERIAGDVYVDLVALSPDERTIILGACVWKNPSSKDISLVAQSYLSTKDSLSNDITVLPALFTSMSQSTLPQLIMKEAQGENIRIIGREEMEELATIVMAGGSLEQVLPVFASRGLP